MANDIQTIAKLSRILISVLVSGCKLSGYRQILSTDESMNFKGNGGQQNNYSVRLTDTTKLLSK